MVVMRCGCLGWVRWADAVELTVEVEDCRGDVSPMALLGGVLGGEGNVRGTMYEGVL